MPARYETIAAKDGIAAGLKSTHAMIDIAIVEVVSSHDHSGETEFEGMVDALRDQVTNVFNTVEAFQQIVLNVAERVVPEPKTEPAVD